MASDLRPYQSVGGMVAFLPNICLSELGLVGSNLPKAGLPPRGEPIGDKGKVT